MVKKIEIIILTLNIKFFRYAPTTAQNMAVVRYTLCCAVFTTHNYIRFRKQTWHCRVTHALCHHRNCILLSSLQTRTIAPKVYKMTTTRLPHKITEFRGIKSQLAVNQDCVILQYQHLNRKHREKCLRQFQRISRWL